MAGNLNKTFLREMIANSKRQTKVDRKNGIIICDRNIVCVNYGCGCE